MATKAKIVKNEKLQKNAKYSTQVHSRCKLCGRPRGYMREFGMCRICFRTLAHKGDLPGVTKSSW